MKIVLTLVMLFAGTAQAAYKCTDEKGITHFGDTPPAGCAKVMMYEISRSGAILRKIEPTPSPEQIKAIQEEAARRKEAEKADAEQRRKDVALLATYSSEKEFDTSRDLNLQPIEGRIASARERSALVEARRKYLEGEMEFYKAGKARGSSSSRAAPPQLVADLERTNGELVSLEKLIAEQERELQQVRERFETDKKRWVELKRLHREGKLDLRDPHEVEAAKKAKAGTAQRPVKKYDLYLVPAR